MNKKELESCLEIACETLATMDALCVKVGAMDDKGVLDPNGWKTDIIETMKGVKHE